MMLATASSTTERVLEYGALNAAMPCRAAASPGRSGWCRCRRRRPPPGPGRASSTRAVTSVLERMPSRSTPSRAAISSSSSRAPARVSTSMPASPRIVDASGCRFSSSRAFTGPLFQARAGGGDPGRVAVAVASPRVAAAVSGSRASRLAPTIRGGPRISPGPPGPTYVEPGRSAVAAISSGSGTESRGLTDDARTRRPGSCRRGARAAREAISPVAARPGWAASAVTGTPASPGRDGRARRSSSRLASLVSRVGRPPAVAAASAAVGRRRGGPGHPVRLGGDRDDPRAQAVRAAGDQLGQQQPGQREVAEDVGRQLQLEAVDRARVRRRHDAGVVDQQVQRAVRRRLGRLRAVPRTGRRGPAAAGGPGRRGDSHAPARPMPRAACGPARPSAPRRRARPAPPPPPRRPRWWHR